MMESLTFRFTKDDGSVFDETVDLDFADVPPDVFARAIYDCEPDDTLGMAAVIVHSRLSDPDLASVEQLRGLFVEMTRGEGVVDGG